MQKDLLKKENIYRIVLPILCLILAILAYFKTTNTNNDPIKFKEEYEALNGEKTTNGNEYNTLEISEDNKIKYSNYDEIKKIIKKGTGIIYLGFPTCPWCRSAIPVLFDVVDNYDIDTIYYLDIKNERDSYIVEEGKLVYALDENGNELKGTDGYFDLLELLDEHLSDYSITIDDEVYEVGEKRIYAPSVIFVHDGKVLGIHVSTVSSQKSGYDKLTDEQYDELYGIYEDYILEMTSTTCDTDSSC